MAKSYGRLLGKFGIVAILATVASGTVSATTVRILSSAGATDLALFDPPYYSVNDQFNQSFDTLVDGTSLSGQAQTETPNTFASSESSVDIVTGKLRSRSEASSNSSLDFPNESGSSSTVLLDETFTVVGNGTVTVAMAYDGFWSVVPKLVDTPSLGAGINLALGNRGNVDSQSFSLTNSTVGNSGSTAGTLNTSVAALNGDTLTLHALLTTEISRGIGSIDFANTATLSFILSPGLTLKFSDDRFLSGTSNPSPVPLPAGLPLLVSAIGAFGIGRCVRRKPCAAV